MLDAAPLPPLLNSTFRREFSTTSSTTTVTASVLDINGSFGPTSAPATFHIHVEGGNGSFTTTVHESGTDLFAGQTVVIGATDGWIDAYLGSLRDAVTHRAPSGTAGGDSVNQITLDAGGVSATIVQTAGSISRTVMLDNAGHELSQVLTDAGSGAVLQSLAFTYDARGRTTTQIVNGATTAWTYDDAGHQLSQTFAFGTSQAATTQFVYQGDNLVQVIDPVGNITSYGYYPGPKYCQ